MFFENKIIKNGFEENIYIYLILRKINEKDEKID